MATAALYHVQFDVVQRSKGQSAVKVAAYNAAARFEAGDGKTYDFRRKAAEHQGHAVLLPPGAPAWAADAAELWRRAEAAEKRADAQPARLVEFAIPRDVPPEQRIEFARAIVQPLVDEGMAAQLDLHRATAADGEEQPHVHVVLTMRRFDGDGFAAKKERGWNQAFQEEKGRVMRGEIAARMNGWLEAHGLESRVDHRSAKERGDDTPAERDVPKKTVEAWKKDPASDAAQPFRQALEHREIRRQLRRAQRAATAWASEARRLDSTLRAIEERTPGARPPGRRRGAPRPPWAAEWTPPADASHFAGCEIRGQSALLTLTSGGAILDRGDSLTMRGKVSDAALAAMAEQAARHGWREVELTGDPAFRDRLAAAMQARGIATTNHGKASMLARRQAERVLVAERKAAPQPTPTAPKPAAARQVAPQPRPAAPTPEPSRGYAPTLAPAWAKGPRRPEDIRRK